MTEKNSTEKKRPPLKRRRQRLLIAGLLLPTLMGAALVSLIALQGMSVYSSSPKELKSRDDMVGRTIRLSGLVASGSILPSEGLETSFEVTDCVETVKVVTTEMLPGLFREKQGVVVKGKLQSDGVFLASEVMARHDENYMPPEAAKALEGVESCESYTPPT